MPRILLFFPGICWPQLLQSKQRHQSRVRSRRTTFARQISLLQQTHSTRQQLDTPRSRAVWNVHGAAHQVKSCRVLRSFLFNIYDNFPTWNVNIDTHINNNIRSFTTTFFTITTFTTITTASTITAPTITSTINRHPQLQANSTHNNIHNETNNNKTPTLTQIFNENL